MQGDYSTFKIPSFAKEEAFDFAAVDDFHTIYQELSQISEEIEKCRLRNC